MLRSVEPPIVAGRVPPHDLDAEAAVLSAVLLKPEALDRIGNLLTQEHFYSESNGWIFAAIQAVSADSKPIDVVTVADWLRARERFANVGGMAYLRQIIDATPAVWNVKAHAQIVRERWRLRRVIAECQRISAEGYGDVGDPQQFIAGAEQALYALSSQPEHTTSMMLDEALGLSVAGAVAMRYRTATGAVAGTSTGIGRLDKLTGGLSSGDLLFIGAPTGGGKSALAGGLVLETCAQGFVEAQHDHLGAPVLDENGARVTREVPYGAAIFTMEMSAPEYATRLACTSGHVDFMRLRTGEADAAEMGGYIAACDRIKALPVYLEQRTDLSPAKLRAGVKAARAALRERGARLRTIVVDTVQLMEPDERRDNESEANVVDRVGRELRKLSQDAEFADLTWIVCSQLNADGQLRGSRALDQHAVCVWIVSVDKATRSSLAPEGVTTARIHIRKQRNGPFPRNVPLWFHGRHTRFAESSGSVVADADVASSQDEESPL